MDNLSDLNANLDEKLKKRKISKIKSVVIKKEKILSDDESKDESEDTDEKSSNTNDDGKNISIIDKQVTSKPVAYDDVKKKLMEKYSEMVSNKNTFEGTQGSWYTLKFYTMKETSAANYYLVEMEFSNDNQDPMKQLNIWLKATYIHDVLKYLATSDRDTKQLFNGFEKVIAAGELTEVRLNANGSNTCRANTSNGFIYKQYINYYLIPKDMGPFKQTITKFKDTMVDLLKSDEFFSMMVVYQDKRNNHGSKPGQLLKDPNSAVWTQLKAPNNNKLDYMNALDTRFMDHDINIILARMFGNKNTEPKYQKFGWLNKGSDKNQKSKM